MPLRLVTWVYRLGILAGLGVAFTALLAPLVEEVPALPAYTLFVVGVSHMLFLVAVAWFTPAAERLIAAQQVQTAGYLHTLIGFSVILILMGTTMDKAGEDFNLSIVLGPLGSALLTSIIGWFVGGEIARGSGLDDSASVRSETARVVVELSNFARDVKRAHADYIKGITELNTAHEELTKKQHQALERAQEVATQLNSHLEPLQKSISAFSTSVSKVTSEVNTQLGSNFQKTLQEIGKRAKEVEAGLKKTAVNAEDTSKYLQESRKLIEELERLLKHVTEAHHTAA